MHRLHFKDLVLDGIKTRPFPPRTPRDRLRLEFAAALALSVIFALAWGEWSWSSLIVLGFLTAYVAAALWLRHDDKARRRPRPVLNFLDATIFSSAFHIDVERWARARGDDPHADEVFLKRRRRELSDSEGAATGNENNHNGPDFSRLHLWYRRGVLDFVFGYRVRWQRALHVFVLFWLLNWAVFLPHAAMESTTNAREPDSREWATAPASHQWGPQHAFFMATRLQVPFVELFIDTEWKPADRVMFDRDGDGGLPWLTYENYAAIMRILNLILVPVIIAGATGLLKPREAQYTGAS